MTGPETRPSLVLRLQNSADQRAWAEFVEIYQPLILRTLRSRGLQEADAREVCQEVLLAVSRAVERWDARPERGSFRGWLSSITRNLCVNFLIRRARHPQPLGDETQLREWLESAPAADSEASRWFALEERRQQLRWAAERVRPNSARRRGPPSGKRPSKGATPPPSPHNWASPSASSTCRAAE